MTDNDDDDVDSGSVPTPAPAPAPLAIKYNSGNATVRACRHRLRYAKDVHPNQTLAAMVAASDLRPMPSQILRGGHAVVPYDVRKYPLRESVTRALLDLLRDAGPDSPLGAFAPLSGARLPPLESLSIRPEALSGRGGKRLSQRLVSDLLPDRPDATALLDAFVEEAALPWLKRRMLELDPDFASELRARRPDGEPRVTFHWQRPPTLRLQPGPSDRHVRTHADSEYGHQPGEVNFWLPLTRIGETRTTLWAESAPGRGDYGPLEVDYGEAACFHGSSCRHYVPSNPTENTRVSLDFRVGIEGYFNAEWSMDGKRADHTRRTVVL